MDETVQSGIGRARYGKRLDSLVRPRLGSDTVIAAPKTARGRATRERIVTAASELIHERGVAEDRAALLRAVVAHNADGVLGDLPPLDGWKAIRSWFDALVALQVERRACGGCPIGALVGQLAESDADARVALAHSFEEWHARLRDGLRSMQRSGKLDPTADPDGLATATLASIQGGLLLTQARRDHAPLATALDAAYANLRAHAASTRGRVV